MLCGLARPSSAVLWRKVWQSNTILRLASALALLAELDLYDADLKQGWITNPTKRPLKHQLYPKEKRINWPINTAIKEPDALEPQETSETTFRSTSPSQSIYRGNKLDLTPVNRRQL
ncbi:hypothetical protein EPR50_G00139800 [Perca flavescens]|uniref:Uncharacterized protein n=1 Tax=Perca flavescens TaxID=8167 RepID=A0A484CNS6_PERFV|nr:hypothetical protein EPR50_G00139800 [Perca flavescens]